MKNNKRLLFSSVLLTCFSLVVSFSQEKQLAIDYFTEGEFEKSRYYYEKVYKKVPAVEYLDKIITCYQQEENYKEAERRLFEEQKKKPNYPIFFVLIGNNYYLQNKKEAANYYFERAISEIAKHPNHIYSVVQKFEKLSLLVFAKKAYLAAKKINNHFSYDYQLAKLYGEMNEIEQMFDSYLNVLENSPENKQVIMQHIQPFLSENALERNNKLFKKLVLKRIEKSPSIIWNELLSKLFIRQRQYRSAFVQQRAVFLQTESEKIILDMLSLVDETGNESKDLRVEILNFIIINSLRNSMKLTAHITLLKVKEIDFKENYDDLKIAYKRLLRTFNTANEQVAIYIAYAGFLKAKESKLAIDLLETFLIENNLSEVNGANIKMKLGELYLYEDNFDEAILKYTQVQVAMKNNQMGYLSRYKVAELSFYKGDFEWAEVQLKVLKASSSQLIANDALQLYHIITDNKYDKTQNALRKYAKAKFFMKKKNYLQSIKVLDSVLQFHKGEKIEDEALFLQANLYEKTNNYPEAKKNYLKIITFYSDDIFIDDALYKLSLLFKKDNDTQKEFMYLEKILFNHPNSIYFVEANKRYRKLRKMNN